MITVQSIVDKIRNQLSQQYPSCTVYIHGLPAVVQRPSFHIYLDTDRSEDNNRSLTCETTTAGITYFPPLEDGTAEEWKALKVYDAVKAIFRKGSLQVDDRVLKVTLLRGGRQNNEVYLLVKLVYLENRPQDETAYDLINEVKIK